MRKKRHLLNTPSRSPFGHLEGGGHRLLPGGKFKKSGFTLLEVIVVISTIVLFLGIGVIYSVSFNRRQAVDQAALDVKSAIENAKNAAASRVKPCAATDVLRSYQIDFSSATGDYSISAHCTTPVTTFTKKLPQNVSFVSVECTPIEFKVISQGVSCAGSSFPVDIQVQGFDHSRILSVDSAGNIAIAVVAPIPTPTPFPTPTASPTPTPSPTLTPTLTPTPTTVPTPTAAPLLVTFDDLPGQNQVLNGQYPSTEIDWGTNIWYHSGPWRDLATKNFSFNGGTSNVTKPFRILKDRKAISIRAFNGSNTASNIVRLSCAGQPDVEVTLPPNAGGSQVTTITTGWGAPCNITTAAEFGVAGRYMYLFSGNGWDTNFDDLVIE